jgi:Sec7-like guanine-nucleotide exchange factor
MIIMDQEDHSEDSMVLNYTELYLSCLSNHLINEHVQHLTSLLLQHTELLHSSDVVIHSLSLSGAVRMIFGTAKLNLHNATLVIIDPGFVELSSCLVDALEFFPFYFWPW